MFSFQLSQIEPFNKMIDGPLLKYILMSLTRLAHQSLESFCLFVVFVVVFNFKHFFLKLYPGHCGSHVLESLDCVVLL